MDENILEYTRNRLRKRLDRAPHERMEMRRKIAEAAGVNVHWLEKFDQGAGNNPSWSRLYKLYCYLRGNDASTR